MPDPVPNYLRRPALTEKLKIEIAVSAASVDSVIEAIAGTAQTGQIGDGKIFVSSIERAQRIRTGETDAEAL